MDSRATQQGNRVLNVKEFLEVFVGTGKFDGKYTLRKVHARPPC